MHALIYRNHTLMLDKSYQEPVLKPGEALIRGQHLPMV